ncbi:MAG: TIR domain-containing protein, partial [Acidobacteriota bacterium]
MRIFLSHSSADIEPVKAFATALEARGLEVWLDHWDIDIGVDFVDHINKGLDACDVGLVVLSQAAAESGWVRAELSAMTWASVEEGKPLIPVTLHGDAPVPPLLRPLVHRDIRAVDAIAAAIQQHRQVPPIFAPAASGPVEKLTIRLRRDGEAIEVSAALRGEVVAREDLDGGLPRALIREVGEFRGLTPPGLRRDSIPIHPATEGRRLREMGEALRGVCFPGEVEVAVLDLLDLAMADMDRRVEVAFESDAPELLSLPFETIRLADGELLVMHPKAIVLRRLAGARRPQVPSVPKPLKVLVAVAAPDEGQTQNVELDYERELQNILDAAELAEETGHVEVRLLEVGSPESIAAAFRDDGYHVLHLSCHGGPGVLELENELGEAVPVTAEELLEPLRRRGHQLPLVVLNT